MGRYWKGGFPEMFPSTISFQYLPDRRVSQQILAFQNPGERPMGGQQILVLGVPSKV